MRRQSLPRMLVGRVALLTAAIVGVATPVMVAPASAAAPADGPRLITADTPVTPGIVGTGGGSATRPAQAAPRSLALRDTRPESAAASPDGEGGGYGCSPYVDGTPTARAGHDENFSGNATEPD